MKAYIIADVEITDPVRYEDYKKLTPVSLQLFGGKFIVRGGRTETLEGDWHPSRFVMIEFPSRLKTLKHGGPVMDTRPPRPFDRHLQIPGLLWLKELDEPTIEFCYLNRDRNPFKTETLL